MDLKILSTNNEAKGNKTLPKQFEEEIRVRNELKELISELKNLKK